MSDLVTIEKKNGIADVRFNRVDKYNALSPEMFQAIIDAGESLLNDRSVRVVVLSGNGKGFCAGLDMSSFQGMAGGERRSGGSGSGVSGLMDRGEHPENHAQRPALIWKRLPVPVIAAIHGVAFGGGCQIALGADIRIAAPSAKLSIMEIKWGLIPDMSITQTLRELVPLDVAKELTFTGRILSGTEAQQLGLVTRVADDPLAAALALAEEIAGKSPDAIRAGKKLLEESWRADERTGLVMESELQVALMGKPNQIEAVMSNFENRAPVYQDG